MGAVWCEGSKWPEMKFCLRDYDGVATVTADTPEAAISMYLKKTETSAGIAHHRDTEINTKDGNNGLLRQTAWVPTK
jgi:hypothetical protein